MQNFDFDNKRLHSLSQRFKGIFKINDVYSSHQDHNINIENLQYGVADFIAKLITRMVVQVPAKEKFETHLQIFNSDNGTNLLFNDFERKGWVRIINDEIFIPGTVSHILYSAFESENKDSKNISEEQLLQLKCLHEFKKNYGQVKPFIGLAELDIIFKSSSNSALSKIFFIERDVIEESGNGKYIWKNNEYTRFLKNEIAAFLWLKIIDNEEVPQLNNYKTYLRLLVCFGIWVDDLSKYITYQQTQKLQELTLQFLQSESDLDNSPQEIAKVYWDAPLYQHNIVSYSAPNFQFTAQTSYGLIQQADYFESLHQGLFDYQGSRSAYSLAIRFLFFKTTPENDILTNFTGLFNYIQKPYLILEAFDLMKQKPFVIPYLLLNLQTAPIFFYRLSSLEVDSNILETQDYLQQPHEANRLKSDIWMEAFKYLLKKILEERSFEDGGRVIALILDQASLEVFKYRSGGLGLGKLSHNTAKSIFDSIWQILKNFRGKPTGSLHGNDFRTRLLVYILPFLVEEFLKKEEVPWRNEFIHLNFHRITNAIENLKVDDTLQLFGEFNDEEYKNLSNNSSTITQSICNLIIEYFTKEETYVVDYWGNTQLRRAKRGVNDFGIELVEWSYLFLHFNKLNLTDILNETFKKSLSFDNMKEKEYSDLNREQHEKLRIYLTILSLAHKGLVKNLSSPNLTMLPLSDTVRFLETTIKHYALTYNRVDLVDQRIDIFDQHNYASSYNLQMPLSLHLYESINLFQYENKVYFLKSFFELNTHIGQLISALNRFDSADAREIVSGRLSVINVENFIKNAKTVTDLENTLIEAVNSDNHYDMATPLLSRIEKHLEKVNLNTDTSRQFLFRIKLLLAFKNKNEELLLNLPIPKSNYQTAENFEYYKRQQNYFLALHKLYNQHEYIEAIQILQDISAQEPRNVDFAFHLYRARLQKAILV